MYDSEVMNLLLNIARRNLASTFVLYRNYHAESDTAYPLCLAMAAIGALFLGAECGITMAKALYNDARRLHFEDFHSNSLKSSFKAATESVKTFILLAIYGICSGDKRSYEFIEAFHVNLMQGVQHLFRLTPSEVEPVNCQELMLIAEALDILECYHVLLLQRPPLFLPSTMGAGLKKSYIDLTGLFSPTDMTVPVRGSLREVAILGKYTWFSSPRGDGKRREWQLWRSEFVELGLERWMHLKSTSTKPNDLPSILIYHLGHLQLHVNLEFLQVSARDFMRPAQTTQEENIHRMLHHCISCRHFEAAVWHAEAMLRAVREGLDLLPHHQPKIIDKWRVLEPPHLSYCIYFSTLVVWYGEYLETGIRSLNRDARVKDGIHLLGLLKVRIAMVLTHALRELLPDEHLVI
jgi:hypothetical protein